MELQQSHHNRQQLEHYLADRLGPEDEARIAAHLDTCDLCQKLLAELVATPAEWTEARDLLSSFADQSDAAHSADSNSRPMTSGELGDIAEANIDLVIRQLAPTDDPYRLGRLGPFEIQGVIGAGGMGVVLKGFDPSLHRTVAIKVLAPHLAASGSARRRFAREAQAAAAVVHNNVVEIHGVAEADGVPYFVMPYLRGASLQKRLDERGPLELVEILRIGMQVAAGLSAAHAQGLVHRDIKPANILLEDGIERLKITDFGLARTADDASLTRTGVIAGTPQYMSPEQARGDSVDPQSDLFSLGSVLYTLCTGRPPFRAETSLGVLRRITDTEPQPIQTINPEIPAWLTALISRLHAKDKRQRFQTAREVADLLERCLAHVQQPQLVPLPRWPGYPPPTSLQPARLRLVAALLVILLGIAGLSWNPFEEPRADTASPLPAHASPARSSWEDGVAEQIEELTLDLNRFWDEPGVLQQSTVEE